MEIQKNIVSLPKNCNKYMKIVVLDGYTANPGDLSWEGLEALGNVKVYDRTKADETLERAQEADIILTNNVVISREVMTALPNLKYIGVLATGYNVVDIDAAHERGVTVTNVPAYSTESVVQMVFAHLLTVTNHTEHYAHENRQGRWSQCPDFCYWDNPIHELSGKTLGIIGLGNIGMRVAQVAQAFGMKVKALTSKPEAKLPKGIIRSDLQELLKTSDVISLHCPLTPETHHLINAETLRWMAPYAILINTGRGPLVDDNALAEALKAGQLRAYCADVITVEPPLPQHPLLQVPNVYLIPHIAWATIEARSRLIRIVTDNVIAFLKGKSQNVI